MKDIDDLRRTLSGFGGANFAPKELIRDYGFSVSVYKQLYKLEKEREIERIDAKPAQFKVLKLKDTAPVRKEKRAKRISQKNDIPAKSPWANIFPEFFTLPQISGTSRFIFNFTE